jgi:hypothetical protein
MNTNLFGARLAKAAVGLLLGSCVCFAAPSCPKLDAAESSGLVDYLQNDRSQLEPSCIEFAIARLKDRAYVPAANVLTSYLDFKVPRPSSGIVVVHELRFKQEYPAAEALVGIGLPAVGSLVRAVGNIESSDVLRENAEDVILFIYNRNPAAIALVRQASKAAPDANTAARLFESAIRLARKCSPDWRSACEAALN